MLNLSRDIHSLTDFKRNTNEFARQMKETGEPLVLTVNGKAEFVIQDAQSYQFLLERLERMERAETVEGIRRGIQEMAEGKGRPLEEALSELEAKFGVQGE